MSPTIIGLAITFIFHTTKKKLANQPFMVQSIFDSMNPFGTFGNATRDQGEKDHGDSAASRESAWYANGMATQ